MLSVASNTRAQVLQNWQFIDICSLVPEWQGRELEKSSSLAKNDVVEFFSRFWGASRTRRFSNIADIYKSLSSTQDLYSAQEIPCV